MNYQNIFRITKKKINYTETKHSDEYILKVMCKDPNDPYAKSLLDSI